MLGYALGKAWWGRGLATEAAVAAVSWAVKKFGLRRLWASTEIGNVRSVRVLEKLGMVREAVRLAADVGRDGLLVYAVVYGIEFT
jgi:ribosomal-protein-alanine N-acetyltransferase